MRLALASCSNYPHGYFNVYGRIAARPDIDAVLHLGDYIYEYEQGRYVDKALTDRAVDPPHEITALDDYRRRYALYRTDPDLQEAHRQHPFIAVWDDHEIANNTWSTGADNHQPADGDFTARRNAAYQAFLEWLPVRDTGSARQPLIYRSFAFGDLADLVMLDTRLAGRDVQVERTDVLGIEDPRRTILGAAQEHWLDGELRESVRAGARWQILGQQVMFAPQTPYNTTGGNPDSWDGYRASRSHVYDMVERHQVPNLVVLTGDVHSAWAFDLPRQLSDRYDPATGRGSLGVEIVCPAVSSPSAFLGPEGEARLAETPKTRPHLKFLDGRSRGYVVLDITRDRLQADWWFVPAVNVHSTEQRFGKGLVSEAGSRHLDRRRLADGGAHRPRPGAVAPDAAETSRRRRCDPEGGDVARAVHPVDADQPFQAEPGTEGEVPVEHPGPVGVDAEAEVGAGVRHPRHPGLDAERAPCEHLAGGEVAHEHVAVDVALPVGHAPGGARRAGAEGDRLAAARLRTRR